ncbi:hypothetical protein EXN66_Car021289 [Channa argus]|uniref:Uncharacterized protein n=1 Tax=Channa argus TaxID=215402 RepID=A0A6G1QTQ5_CHAAH|nr:hypothetical protein EXN66_Car021289 [Channa argus]
MAELQFCIVLDCTGVLNKVASGLKAKPKNMCDMSTNRLCFCGFCVARGLLIKGCAVDQRRRNMLRMEEGAACLYN